MYNNSIFFLNLTSLSASVLYIFLGHLQKGLNGSFLVRAKMTRFPRGVERVEVLRMVDVDRTGYPRKVIKTRGK